MITNLKSKTFSKKCLIEIAAILPAAKSFKRKTVAECGKVLFIYDADQNSIAHCCKDYDGGIGFLKLSVK